MLIKHYGGYILAINHEKAARYGMNETPKITEILREWSDGNRAALEDLMPLVYEELHKQAARFLSRERRDHTLQATALIHETYLKLIDQRDSELGKPDAFFRHRRKFNAADFS